MTDKTQPQHVVLVTGPSGSGRATALHGLEDLGFEIIDNLPLSLLPRLLSGPPIPRPMAIGVDARTRGFSASALRAALKSAASNPDMQVQLLYLDCARDVLFRRFSETRRRHPLTAEGSLQSAIDEENAVLTGLRERADILIDTSNLSPHELRAELARWFDDARTTVLAVSVQSFSYKRGLPHGVDMVLDCRFLRNPHWDKDLRTEDGRNPDVAAYVARDANYEPFVTGLIRMCDLLLPAYRAEGKSYFSIALGCTGGQHRSVAIAEDVHKRLAKAGWHVSIRHRELEAKG
ncbi:MAG: RNase adapter RapZ [Paracoccaceae bacterium]